MAARRGSSAPLVRPELGPPLPTLLRDRLGVPAVVTLAVAAVLGVAGTAALVAASRARSAGGEQLVYRAGPVFNLLYAPDVLRRAAPRPGELVRLEARRGRLSVSVVVAPLRLPARRGDIVHGYLPVFATQWINGLRRQLDGFELRDEGRARVNDAPGYQVGYQALRPGRRIYGRDVFLAPGDSTVRGAVVVRLRQVNTGRAAGARGKRMIGFAKKAFRSFRYGTERG